MYQILLFLLYLLGRPFFDGFSHQEIASLQLGGFFYGELTILNDVKKRLTLHYGEKSERFFTMKELVIPAIRQLAEGIHGSPGLGTILTNFPSKQARG